MKVVKKKEDIEEEYDKLLEIKSDLQKELVELENLQTDEV